MAGHLEQTYFAYLPEPSFLPGNVLGLQLHQFGLHSFSGESACHRTNPERSLTIPEGRQNRVVLQGAVNSCGATIEADAIDFDSSSLAKTLSNTSPFCGTGSRLFNNGLLDDAGSIETDNPLSSRQHETPGAGEAVYKDEVKHSRESQITETAQPPISIALLQSEPSLRAALATFSMQMVIRSQQALAIGIDELAEFESTVDQAVFDALVAGSDSIDEDAMAVNHPCRHYDVANFLTRWAYERYVNKTCLTLEGSDSHLRQLDPHRCVTRRDQSDFQGIPWDSFGTTRIHALEARRLLHAAIPGNQPSDHPIQSSPANRYYRFQSFYARHRPRWAHFQLRNMVVAHSRNEIYHAACNIVHAAALSLPDAHATMMNLGTASNSAQPLHITCLASGSGSSANVLIAGGFNGEYAILAPTIREKPIRGSVSYDYNGLITHISVEPQRRSGSLQATISSNDCSVRVLDITTQCITVEHKLSTSVNATVTSPDHRLRLIVDDTCGPQVMDAEEGDMLVSLSGHTAFGFACAWSMNGRYAATAAEDGRTQIWDSRNWSKPLETVTSTMSCVRSLHFTEDNLLVMAENEDIVTIWDVQQRSKQTLDFFGSIAGVALLDGGNEIVVANSDRTVGGLMVFERQAKSYHWGEEVLYNDQSKATLKHTVEVAATASDTFEDLMI